MKYVNAATAELSNPRVYDCGRYEIEISDGSFSMMLVFQDDDAVNKFHDEILAVIQARGDA